MTKFVQVYKYIGFLSATVFTILGLITLGSILHNTIGFYLNVIMGVIFGAVGYYLYAKTQSVLKLLPNVQQSKVYNRFLLLELVFSITTLFVGILLLSGAISRVFGEQLPIFG